MTATVAGIHLSGDHASRPAANTVPDGSLYSCSTHDLIYQSDFGGNSWATWATLGAAIGDILDLPTAETDDTLVLAPDGAGGVEFRAETGGGGGIISQSYGGYDTVGASEETMANRRIIWKAVTLASDGFIPAIEVNVRGDASAVDDLSAALYDDSGSAPNNVIGYPSGKFGAAINLYMSTTYRWFSIPIGRWCAAGTYWAAVGMFRGGTSGIRIHYDTGGTDPTCVEGGDWWADGATGSSKSDSTKHYSIRVPILS